jgi:hypothetical protein
MQLSPFCFDGERTSLDFPNFLHCQLVVDLILNGSGGIAWVLSV